MNRIRGIFFDLGNVLVMFDASRASKRFAKVFDISEEILWKELFESELERTYTKGEIGSEEFFENIKKRFPSSLSFDKFANIWNDIFWKNEGMEELVKSLTSSYKLYLISNTNHLHFEYIKKNFPVLRYFDRHFPSHKVGFRKPDAAIYRYALEKTGLKPEETIYVDDIREFVESAQALGIRGVVFESKSQLEREFKQLGVLV